MTATAAEPTAVEKREALITAARAERDAGIAAAEDADLTGWDRKLIDQAIEVFATDGLPFSSNTLRPLLPDVRPALMGARFLWAANQGRIRRIGFEPSTKRNTHTKPVALWIGMVRR